MVEMIGAAAPPNIPDWYIEAFVFMLGSIVGSFLNVCIYRLPLEESIIHPGSHCCGCGARIPFYHNIPLVSYVVLKGRAKCCGAPIAFRYWLVELLTASIFLGAWIAFPPAVAACYLVFTSLLTIATFTDLEHYIIPNEITWGSVGAGLVLSALVPALHPSTSEYLKSIKYHVSPHIVSLGISLTGALTAYLVLWAVVELGKIVFGKKKTRFDEPVEITADAEGISTASETLKWDDIFSRPTDQLQFSGKNISLKFMPAAAGKRGKSWEDSSVAISYEELIVGEEKFSLSEVHSLTATCQELVIPREAMGFGDVKFLAGIGAFLGPGSIFFVILVSSLMGSCVGLTLLAIGKRQWGGKLPYGPYLAVAAVIWMFFGNDVIDWYKGMMGENLS